MFKNKAAIYNFCFEYEETAEYFDLDFCKDVFFMCHCYFDQLTST